MNGAVSSAAAAGAPSSATPDPRGVHSRRPELGFAGVLTFFFGLSVALLMWRHAPWRDELQAWAIVRDNPNARDLFAQLHYEGHPALWYLLLWGPARLSRSIVMLQFVQWVLAVGAAFVFAWRAPFSRSARALIAFSYFPLFEYGVIARSYVLVWLLAVVALSFLRQRNGLYAFALCIALLANVAIIAIPLAVGLAVGVLVDARARPYRASLTARVVTGVALVVGIAAAGWTARPASDAVHARTTLDYNADRLASDLSIPIRALVPIPNAFTHFWDTHFTDNISWLGIVLAVVVTCALGWILRRRRAGLVAWLVTVLGVPAILYSRDLYARARFCGVVFVAAIAALWLAAECDPERRSYNRTAWTLGALGCIAGAIAVAAAITTPFSASAATAHWLKTHGYRNAPIVCETAYQCSAVGIRLDRPTRSADQAGESTYVVFRDTNQRGDAGSAYLVAQTIANAQRDAVILLTQERPRDSHVRLLAHFDRSVVSDETYWVGEVMPLR